MQGNTVKDCIRAPVPYLSHPLKMDNLPLICKHVSGNVLHRLGLLFHVAEISEPMIW